MGHKKQKKISIALFLLMLYCEIKKTHYLCIVNQRKMVW